MTTTADRRDVAALLLLARHVLPRFVPVTEDDIEEMLDLVDGDYAAAADAINRSPDSYHVWPRRTLCPNTTAGGCRCPEHHPGLLEYAADRGAYRALLSRARDGGDLSPDPVARRRKRPRRQLKPPAGRRLPQGQSRVDPAITVRYIDKAA